MIKCIIQCADLHIRCFQRMEEYNEQLMKFIDKCKEIASNYEQDEVRIAICGDIVHQKNTISPELISFVASFIRQLEQIAKVIVITGNHDLIVNNDSREGALSAIFDTASFNNTFLLDSELGNESGYIIDDNVTWALYSIRDDFKRPDIEEARENYPNNTVIGLYHGVIVGAQLNNGFIMEEGIDGDIFGGCDIVMAGDIHKRQELKRGGVKIIYSGSLIQQTFGETVTQHGFTVWNMETLEHEHIDLESEYNLYDFEINSFDDIDNDKEILKNY